MPFTKDTAAAAGSKGGGNRWKNKDPETMRDKTFVVKASQAEMDMIQEKAAAAHIKRNELIIRAVKAYDAT